MSPKGYTLNCDLGEGQVDESSIIPYIDLASVACGGHFGTDDSIRETLMGIKKYGKKAGAHPSYPDSIHFGRKSLVMDSKDLIQSIQEQIQKFISNAEKEQISLNHIKFHGALYNDAAENQQLANLLMLFLKNNYPKIPILVPPFSEMEKAAKAHRIAFMLEVFGDRGYSADYRLVSRCASNSLFTDREKIMSQMDYIINSNKIQAVDGKLLPIQADTICIHGDNPGILDFLPFFRDQFWK